MTFGDHLVFDNKDLHIRSIPKAVTDCSEGGGNVVIGPVTSSQAAIASHVAAAYGKHMPSFSRFSHAAHPSQNSYESLPGLDLLVHALGLRRPG